MHRATPYITTIARELQKSRSFLGFYKKYQISPDLIINL